VLSEAGGLVRGSGAVSVETRRLDDVSGYDTLIVCVSMDLPQTMQTPQVQYLSPSFKLGQQNYRARYLEIDHKFTRIFAQRVQGRTADPV
jgi:hypothetical protein